MNKRENTKRTVEWIIDGMERNGFGCIGEAVSIDWAASGFRETMGAMLRKKAYGLEKYGLTLMGALDIYASQRGRCMLCDRAGTFVGKAGLHVDHCHETGTIRGLLCGRCNRALGMAGDNRKNRMINYLALGRRDTQTEGRDEIVGATFIMPDGRTCECKWEVFSPRADDGVLIPADDLTAGRVVGV